MASSISADIKSAATRIRSGLKSLGFRVTSDSQEVVIRRGDLLTSYPHVLASTGFRFSLSCQGLSQADIDALCQCLSPFGSPEDIADIGFKLDTRLRVLESSKVFEAILAARGYSRVSYQDISDAPKTYALTLRGTEGHFDAVIRVSPGLDIEIHPELYQGGPPAFSLTPVARIKWCGDTHRVTTSSGLKKVCKYRLLAENLPAFLEASE